MNLESAVTKVVLMDELNSVINGQSGFWTIRHAIGGEDRFILERNGRYYYTVVRVAPSQAELPSAFYDYYTPSITLENLNELL